MIVLKNISADARIKTCFRGRDIVIDPRGTHVLSDTEEGIAEAKFLTETYGFLLDFTKLASFGRYKIEGVNR